MKYGLLGEKLGHSYSKEIHEMLGAYSYELLPTPPGEVGSFLEARKFDGLNVTIPYKQTVIPYCDGLDPSAKSIGAVNTLYFRDGKMMGGNTDAAGMAYMAARAGISMHRKHVLILGDGGTSRTARYVAASMGASEVTIASRHPREPGILSYDRLPKTSQVIINTTPVGCFPHNLGRILSPLDFPNLEGVLDVVYNPLRTPLVMEALEAGIPASGGLPMLVAQATQAANLFTGESHHEEKNEEILTRLVDRLSNIVFIGMPGSGKSLLGQLLAEAIGKPFIDLDQEIETVAGKPIPEIFATEGEAFFRDLESKVTAETGKKTGQVISTGGGVVLRRENMLALEQNGIIIHVKRDIESLGLEGRPLSKDRDALGRMAETRLPLYEKYRDLVVENDDTPREVLGKLGILVEGSLGWKVE